MMMMTVNKSVIEAQAGTLSEWAEQWSRDTAAGTSEIAFLLKRAARVMRGALPSEYESEVTVLEIGLPNSTIVSELAAD